MTNYYENLMKLPQVKKAETSHKVDKGILKGKCCTIYIPLKFVAMMNLIHDNLENKGDEFTVFFKVEVDDEDPTVYYILEDDYIIPQQIVTPSHFTNKEDINFKKYNSCIHRHPQGVTKFSSTDEQWLNDNVEVSVLFIPSSKTNKNIFPYAIVNLPLANGKKVQMEAECIIDDDIFYEEEREVIYDKLKRYVQKEYITDDIEITAPEDYSNKVIVNIPLDNNNMTLKVDYDLLTKEEREDIISDVKKYIKHDTSYDRPKVNAVTHPRQFGKVDRVKSFFSNINTEQVDLTIEKDPSDFGFDVGNSDFDNSFYSEGDFSYYKNNRLVNM